MTIAVDEEDATEFQVEDSAVNQENSEIVQTKLESNEVNVVTWGKLLQPAPVIISLLSQLIVYASKVDVSLESGRGKNDWKRVEYPQSLRASLLQLGNGIWGAFRLAESNMDCIQLRMTQVPTHMQTAIKLAKKKIPNALLNKQLLIAIESIKNDVKKCEEAAEATVMKFNEVLELMNEISVAVEVAKSTHDRLLKVNEGKFNGLIVSHISLEEEKGDIQKERYKAEEKITASHKAYDKAVDAVPIGWNGLAMDAVRGGGHLVANVVNGLVSLVTFPRDVLIRKKKKKTIAVDVKQQWGSEKQELLIKLQTIFNSDFKKSSEKFSELQGTFNAILTVEKNADAKKIFEGAIVILQDILNESRCMSAVDAKEKAIFDIKIEKLIEQGQNLAKLDDFARSAAEKCAEKEMEWKAEEKGRRGNKGESNEVYLLKMRQQELRRAEKKMESAFEKHKQLSDDLRSIQKEMAVIDVSTLDVNNIREMLMKVMPVLDNIKLQWIEIATFLAKVANQTVVRCQNIISPGTQRAINYDAEELNRDMLVELLSEEEEKINMAAYFLHVISNTYVQVSEQFIFGKLGGMAKFLCAENDNERQRLLDEIKRNANESKLGVEAIVKSQHDAFKAEMLRQKQIDGAAPSTPIIEEECD